MAALGSSWRKQNHPSANEKAVIRVISHVALGWRGWREDLLQ